MNRRRFILLGGASIVGTYAGRSASAQSSLNSSAASLGDDSGESLCWLRAYDGFRTSELVRDPRFTKLLDERITTFPSQLIPGLSLSQLFSIYTESPYRVTVSNQRYVSASGCMAHCGFNRALIWADVKAREKVYGEVTPLVILTFINVEGSSRKVHFTLSNDLSARRGIVPNSFRKCFASWLRLHKSARKWDGGKLNAFEITAPNNSLNLSPHDLGLRPRRCDPPLTQQM